MIRSETLSPPSATALSPSGSILISPSSASDFEMSAASVLLSSTTSTTAPLPPSAARSTVSSRTLNWATVCSRSVNSSIINLRRTKERTRANSATSFTGLVRKSSAPASSPRTRSPCRSRSVIMTAGKCALLRSDLIRRQTSNPSMPGSMTSSNTMSGVSASMRSRPSSPARAVLTSKYSARCFAARTSVVGKSSSTTKTRAGILLAVSG
jgi:hypothetical protein